VEWLLFESLLAFAILVAIVVWTMGPLRKRRSPPDGPRERGAPPTIE
jgi:hypothetical protein